MSLEIAAWVFFNLFVVAALAIDLGFSSKSEKSIGALEGVFRWGIWIFLAFVFCIGVYYVRGYESALNFFTGFLVEKALSIDNLFVFLTIFTYFSVEKRDMHRVLFWGVLGAIVLRAIFIFSGVVLIQKFHSFIYFFGVLVIIAGIKMAISGQESVHPEKNIFLKLFKKIIPVTKEYHGHSFFIKENNKWVATPLFIVLLMIESSDVVFAIDSVPAILAITTDPFIVYTSNIFAILGLRSIYFSLEGMFGKFHFLSYGLSAMLVFIGVKMLLSEVVSIPVEFSLGVILGILTLSISASFLFPKSEKQI